MNIAIRFVLFSIISLSAYDIMAQDSFNADQDIINKYNLYLPAAGGGNSAGSIVQFTVSAGVSSLVFRNDEDDPILKDYLKKLKRGFYFQSDIAYVLSNNFSVGIKYNLHKSKNSITDVVFTDGNGNTIVGEISDDISIGFAGIVLNGRLLSENEKNIINAGISIGSINYKNNSVTLDPIIFEGSTLGMLYNLGYEYAMNERFGLGLNLNYSFGTITTLKRDGVELNIPGGISLGTGRVQLGAIVFLHF